MVREVRVHKATDMNAQRLLKKAARLVSFISLGREGVPRTGCTKTCLLLHDLPEGRPV